MSDLSDFLLARIAEDEAAAGAATWGSWSAEGVWTDAGNHEWQIGVPDQDDASGRPIIAGMYGPNARADVAHIARHDPARVLAECEAKRQIVALASWTGPKDTLRDKVFGPATDEAVQQGIRAAMRSLALLYADHPDYREEWRP